MTAEEQALSTDRIRLGEATRPTALHRRRPAPIGHWPAGICILSIAWLIEKLAAFCRGGNSLKVSRNFAT